MSLLQTRFHVVFDGQRTTVSVDAILFEFARRYLIRAIADKRLTTKRTQWIVKKDK